MADEQDWGGSDGAKLALTRAEHDHRKNERQFQLNVVVVFSALTLALVIAQAINANLVAKDLILVVLPVFTFVLGKLDTKNG